MKQDVPSLRLKSFLSPSTGMVFDEINELTSIVFSGSHLSAIFISGNVNAKRLFNEVAVRAI